MVLPFPKLKKSRGIVGLELHAGGIAAVAFRGNVAATGEAVGLDFLQTDTAGSAAEHLRQWVDRHDLENFRCNVVLAPEHYQMVLVEPPDVPAEELRNAIRWRLKDLISIPVDKAVIDVFELPTDGLRANKKMVYVIASTRDKIEEIIGLVAAAGLKLEAIDIGELALRNIAVRLTPVEQEDRSIAIARLRSGSGSLYIYRQGNLYLARNFALNYGGGLLDEIPVDNLALELQRSVDYFERQMGQAPPSMIYICGEHMSKDKINTALKTSLAVKVEFLDPAPVLQVATDDEELLQHCLGAFGGALRQESQA